MSNRQNQFSTTFTNNYRCSKDAHVRLEKLLGIRKTTWD